MPSTITPVNPPAITGVSNIDIYFSSDQATATVVVSFSDGSVQRFGVPADSTFLSLAAATGTRKTRMYNVLLPLCGFTVGVIT